ncbi:MAG: AMP-binding protein [Oscillospiraceae bacterium]|nr:AMP-binding protein [Oscillospiraceae bacterium]
MSQSLQSGLYELCEKRIAEDREFLALTGTCDNPVSDRLFDAYRLWQLQKTVKLVSEESPFYRRLYSAAGVAPEDIRCLQDLEKLPFTTSTDLESNPYRLLCTSQSKIERPVTFFSSGSVGQKKRVFFSQMDIQKILDFLPRGMHTVINPGEGRIQVLLQNSQGRGVGEILAKSLRLYGMQAWTSELQDDTEDIFRLASENRVNVWFGDALTILRASRILAQEHDLRHFGMQCIFLTMTNIPDSMVQSLEDIWGCRVSTHYGLTEAGWGLAVDCEVCGGYHYNELDHIIEIVDPETGVPLPYGETGEVVLTTIARECMPLLRYRTGDIAALSQCRCGGHLDILAHIVRRKEGACRIAGRELYPALFDEILFRDRQVLDYRVYTDGEQLFFDAEVLRPNCFDTWTLTEQLRKLPVLQGMKPPHIRALPVGVLRTYAFEKKRVLPVSERVGATE